MFPPLPNYGVVMQRFLRIPVRSTVGSLPLPTQTSVPTCSEGSLENELFEGVDPEATPSMVIERTPATRATVMSCVLPSATGDVDLKLA